MQESPGSYGSSSDSRPVTHPGFTRHPYLPPVTESHVPYQRLAAAVLTQWREVERAMKDPAVGIEAMAALQTEADRLRADYQDLVRQAINEHRPEPPPFPKA